MEEKQPHEMTIEELVVAAGNPAVTRDSFLYINIKGMVVSAEIPRHWRATPADCQEAIGYAKQ